MRGTAAELAARFAEPPEGEVVVVIGPAAAAPTPADGRRAAARGVALHARRRASAPAGRPRWRRRSAWPRATAPTGRRWRPAEARRSAT